MANEATDQPACSCHVVEHPWTYYGAVEPGGAFEPDPECQVHFPELKQKEPVMAETQAPIARIHVDDHDPEIHTGDDALIVAYQMAAVYRTDFPNGVVGVSYNSAAWESRQRIIMEGLGIDVDEDVHQAMTS